MRTHEKVAAARSLCTYNVLLKARPQLTNIWGNIIGRTFVECMLYVCQTYLSTKNIRSLNLFVRLNVGRTFPIFFCGHVYKYTFIIMTSPEQDACIGAVFIIIYNAIKNKRSVEDGGKDDFYNEEKRIVVNVSYQIFMIVIYLIILQECQFLILNFY
jgi:hypothetical protein